MEMPHTKIKKQQLVAHNLFTTTKWKKTFNNTNKKGKQNKHGFCQPRIALLSSPFSLTDSFQSEIH